MGTRKFAITGAVALLFPALAACHAEQQSDESETPVASIDCSLSKGMQSSFVGRLKDYATGHGFSVRVGQPTPEAGSFTVQMWRKDVKLLAVNPFAVAEVKIDFYRADNGRPVGSSVANMAVDLVNFLRDAGSCRYLGVRK